MKVLFTIDTLGSGGKERRLTELIKALQGNKYLTIELVVMSNVIHYDEIIKMDLRIHKLIRRTKKDPCVFFRFYNIIKTIAPDIVHCWDSMTAIYVAPVCYLLKCKFVNGMVIDSPVKFFFNKHWWRGRLTFPLSDVVVGNSEAGLSAYRVPLRKRALIYNGFNFNRTLNITDKIELRKSLKIETDYVVGMVARFSSMKDYATYFHAAYLVLEKRKDVTFLAIGAETDSDAALSLVANTNPLLIKLLGERLDIEALINILDIGILATFTEGISNSILEYMAFGKPVVASGGGGNTEIIVNEETGFLLTTGDAFTMAGKIELLLSNSDLRRSMGDAGKARVVTHFSIARMVNDYIHLYQKLFNPD